MQYKSIGIFLLHRDTDTDTDTDTDMEKTNMPMSVA